MAAVNGVNGTGVSENDPGAVPAVPPPVPPASGFTIAQFMTAEADGKLDSGECSVHQECVFVELQVDWWITCQQRFLL